MHIVHVLTRFHRAGTEENTAVTCNGQLAAGHRVTLVHGPDATEAAFALLSPGVERVEARRLRRSISPIGDLRALAELTGLFRRLRPDLVHTHQSKAGVLGRFAAAAAGVPRVVHGVHILAFMNVSGAERLTYKVLERVAAPFTHAFVHVTPALREESLAAGLGAPEQHFVVPSGMDISAFVGAPLPEDAERLARPTRPGGPRPTIVLMVSSLEPRKRPRPFVDMFAGLVAERPDLRLLIAGEGPERAALQAAIAERGLSEQVELLGSRNDVGRLIALSDVCVLASEREGLPRAVIQYALGGRPIVATDLPDIDRLVKDGVNGFVVSGPAAMRDPLLRLVDDPALRARMGAASAALDLSDWDGGRMVARIDEAYALAERRLARRGSMKGSGAPSARRELQ